MDSKLNVNAINNLNAGHVIYKEGNAVDTVSFVLKGRVTVFNQGIKTIMGAGSFIGINDIYENRFISNYVASETVTLYTFEIHKKEDIRKIMKANNDYNGLMIYHLNMYITELSDLLILMRTRIDELFEFIDKVYIENPEMFKNGNLTRYESDRIFDVEDIEYYEESSKLAIDVVKVYFVASANLTLLHISKQANLINELIEECIDLSNYGKTLFEMLYSDKNDSIFNTLARVGLDSKSGGHSQEFLALLDRVADEISKTDRLFSEKSGCKLNSNPERVEEILYSIRSADSISAVSADMQMKYSGTQASDAIESMKNSLNQILDYAELEEFRKGEIRQYISEFKNMEDKAHISEKSRMLRKNITDAYYEIYMKMFAKAFDDKGLNRVIELFLSYGFMDEELLTDDQCIELYYLVDENENKGRSNVYTIWQWLKAIYRCKKEPSKNEFDLEYLENLRDMKKSRKVTPEEEHDYLKNPLKKVEYEIKNMFKYNNRVVSGQISVFVPVLHKESINKTMSKMLITSDRANAEIERITAIDYSAYCREIMFYDEARGIQKEYVMKEAFPDIILMPTVGSNSVMWQEIEGRKRDTSGRFILPAFCDGDLFEQLIKLTGRLRFELCRTIEGTSWNNILEKSLTSEYSDYIQFYSKNRELSEEQKQKIKQQIQRGRNNIREIFMLDYMVWIQNESQGYLRLNKSARVIMATYCPFAKSIREYNVKQPLFKESMARYLKEKQKKARELTLIISKLEKDKIEVPIEIENTRRFYCDL